MEFLATSFLYNNLKLRKDLPIIYVDGEASTKFSNDKTLDQYRNISGLIKVSGVVSLRPFDEMILIVYIKESRKGPYFAICIVSEMKGKHEIDCIFVSAETLISERITNQKQLEWFEEMILVCFGFISKPKNHFNFCETRTKHLTNKNKIKHKKGKIIYVTDKKNLSKNKSIKTNISYEAHSVCGHKRHYYNEPGNPESGLRLSYEGEDRYGNLTIGWTWISPYKTGQGAEILEKIRVYK